MLTASQRDTLVALARDAITNVAQRQEATTDPGEMDLPEAAGVFVTIRCAGALRGCLGTLEPCLGLAAEVVRCAIDSARDDPRFPPVTEAELGDIAVEISVLGPLERIDPDPAAFIVGVHGLVVEDGRHRGLLLPQVAAEWGWTPEQFLRQTSIKAGLAPDAWRQGARVCRFTAEVFGG